MRYLLLIYADEAEMRTKPLEAAMECVRAAQGYDEELKAKGHFIASHGLEWPSEATTLRMKSGRIVSTDGPFSETKEQLLGFLLIEAEGKDEAFALAARLPMLATGSTVELRAIEDLTGDAF